MCVPTEGESGLAAIDLSSDGRWIAVADDCERVHLIDRASGRLVATTNAGERTYCVRFDPSSGLLATACSYQGGGMIKIDKISDGELIPVVELNRSDSRTSGKRFVDTLVHLDFSPDGGSLALFETSAIYHDARPRGWRGDVVLYETGTWKQRWKASVDAKATGDKRSLAKSGSRDGISHGSAVPERRDSGMWGDPGKRPLLPCLGRQTRASSAGSSRSTGRISGS